jgi:hypothetical protein
VPDDTLAAVCPDPRSFGYQCVRGDGPATYDTSLACGAPTPDADGIHDDYCCSLTASSGSSSGGPPPAGCTLQSTLGCTGGASGFACAVGDDPETEDPTLSCSTPALASGEDDYCCFTVPSGFGVATCVPDDGLTSVCPDPTSYGYACASGDDPATYDASLVCSTPTPDPDGIHDDYCCTYN